MGLFGRTTPQAEPEARRGVRAYSAVAITATTGATDAGGRAPRTPKSSTDTRDWQARAYNHYDDLGEIKYAAQFYSRMLAKLDLYVGEINEDGIVDRTTNETAKAAFDDIQDPGGGRSKMQATYGQLQFLVGECYLVGTRSDSTDEVWTWEMLSTDELEATDAKRGLYKRRRSANDQGEKLEAVKDGQPTQPGDIVVYRLWNPHPRYSGEPDAPLRGVLDLCDELRLLAQSVRNRTRSRLASNGFLLIPDDLTLDATQDELDADDEDPEADPVLQRIVDAGVASITDEDSAAALMPIILRGDPETLKEMRVLQVVDPRQSYPEEGLRKEAIERIALGLDMPPEILLGLEQSNHWCVDEETEILTMSGWRRHDELLPGEEVLTLNHQTGLSEWQPLLDVARFQAEGEPMLAIEGRFHSSLTTLNHRWPIVKPARPGNWTRAWHESGELKTHHRIVTGAPCGDVPLEPVYPDAFVELVAWLWTEGSMRTRAGRRRPQVALHQSHIANPEHVASMRGALTSLYGPGHDGPMPSSRRRWQLDDVPRWSEKRHGERKTCFSLNATAAAALVDVAPNRIVSLDFIRQLTRPQLDLFIDVSIKGDGYLMGGRTRIIGQADPARLAAFELAVILSGRTPRRSTWTGQGFTEHTQHCITVRERTTFGPKPRNKTIEAYTGTIWCPVTRNATWLARRNGTVYFTGNTSWMIDEQTWKAHGRPVAERLCDDLSEVILKPRLRRAGMSEEQLAGYVVYYDASQIVNHPNRTRDAFGLHDRIVISDDALIEATGFSQDDKPDQAEKDWRKDLWVRPRLTQTTGGSPGAPSGASSGPDTLAASGPPSLERVCGAVELAVERAREQAGNRLLTRARKIPSLAEQLRGVPTREIPGRIGSLGVATLGNGTPLMSTELVAGATEPLAATLTRWGVEGAVIDHLCSRVETHAAQTRWDAEPAPFGEEIRLLAEAAARGDA